MRKYFKKFGEIKSVELLNHGKCEGYVTFVDSRSAALAFSFIGHKNEQLIKGIAWKEWFVEPANTWHQPIETNLQNAVDEVRDQVDNEEEKAPDIFKLNDDCFQHLFKFCDVESLINLSKVCTFFKESLLCENGSGNDNFRHITALSIVATEVNNSMTLGVAREELRCVGTLIEKLYFEFEDYNRWNLKRYVEKLNQYVGDNIRELELFCMTGEYLPSLAPVLQHLSVLKLNACSYSQYYGIDFQTLCPNLTNLKLLSDMNFGHSCRSWPKLEYISIVMSQNTYDTCSIIKQNVQLKGVKIMLSTARLFEAIVINLRNIEKLTICNFERNISVSHVKDLTRLYHLTELTLSYLTTDAFDIILPHLTKITNLHVLKLHIYRRIHDVPNLPNQNSIIDLVKQLPHLEKLLLLKVLLNEPTIVDIIKFALSLKTFHVHDCNIEWHSSLICDVLNAHKSLQHNESLNMYVDSKTEWENFVNNGMQNDLRASFGCSHPSFEW